MRLPHCIAFSKYFCWFVDVYGKKVITLKMQRSSENACGNRMWQLGLSDLPEMRWLGNFFELDFLQIFAWKRPDEVHRVHIVVDVHVGVKPGMKF